MYLDTEPIARGIACDREGEKSPPATDAPDPKNYRLPWLGCPVFGLLSGSSREARAGFWRLQIRPSNYCRAKEWVTVDWRMRRVDRSYSRIVTLIAWSWTPYGGVPTCALCQAS
jgi:hypothetical protein